MRNKMLTRLQVAEDYSLLDKSDSILIVIDVQDSFLQKLGQPVANRVVERIRWLIAVAKWMEIPIVVTAEEIANRGRTTQAILDMLPQSVREYDKNVFGLPGQEDIYAEVAAIDRKTAIVVGLETDVCVLHTALGLASEGYRVAVVADATASPDIGHDIGLERLRNAGITLVSTKSLFFEWARDLKTCYQYVDEGELQSPADLFI
jgi:nicotinamidase-related amidase